MTQSSRESHEGMLELLRRDEEELRLRIKESEAQTKYYKEKLSSIECGISESLGRIMTQKRIEMAQRSVE